MGALANLLKGTTTAPQKTQKSGGGALSRLISGSVTKVAKPVMNKTSNPVPPGGVKIQVSSGNEAYRTPSGSIWEYLPDGTRQVTVKGSNAVKPFAYNINPTKTNQIVKSPRSPAGEETQPGFQRDHVLSVGLGGASVAENLRLEKLLPKDKQKAFVQTPTDQLEADLAVGVKAGRKTLAQARLEELTRKDQNSKSFLKKVGSGVEDVGNAFKIAGKTALQLPKSLVQSVTKPSAITRQVEQNIIPTPKNPVGRALTAIPRTLAKGAVRLGTPAVEGLGTEIGTFASNPRNPANLPQSSLQSFLNAANFGVAIGGTVKVLGEEAGTGLANKTTTLRITPDEISTKLQNGEIPARVAPFFEELVKRNQTVEVSGPEPRGGISQKVGQAIGGEIKPANPQFSFSGESPETSLQRLTRPVTKLEGGFPSDYYHRPLNAPKSALKSLIEPQAPKPQAITPSAPQAGFIDPGAIASDVKGSTPSKIAQSIETKAVEQKLTQGFEGLAGYDKITIKDQAEKATRLLSDPEKTMRVIKGEDSLPTGLRGTALITAAEEYIKKTGDARMAYELANSPLVSETSTAAQELRLAAEREPDSLAAKIQEIKKVREAQATRKYGNIVKAKAKIKSELKTAIKDSIPKIDEWTAFIDEIKCI